MSTSFCTGIVSITTDSGLVFVGTCLGTRHQDDSNTSGISYIYIQLTTAVGPYTIGEIVALNPALVISIGPVTL